MINREITPEDVDAAILKMRYPKPKISSDEAVKKAHDFFMERAEWDHPITMLAQWNHCAPTTIKVLQEAYDLPGGDLPFWIATGFRGGVCLGEICGAISGGVIAMGLMAYRALEPRTEHEERIACQAIMPYIRDLAYVFNSKFGSINCGVLTGLHDRTPEENEIILRTWYGKEHICRHFIEFVVGTMVRWGEVSQEPPKRVLPGTPPLRLG